MMLMDLLQRKAGNPPPPNADAVAGIMTAYFIVLGVVAVVIFVVDIFFLLSLSKCLQAVAPENRKMEPGMVWLNLIPLFNYVWLILTILRVAESLENEYRSRGMTGDGDYGKMMGIIYYVSMFVCACVAVVFWVLYWMKIAGYTRELTGGSPRRRPPRDEYDDDNDR